MKTYDTLSQAMNSLKEDGYTIDFHAKGNALVATNDEKSYSADDFDIDEVHRFEGMTNPGDMSILYAISSRDGSKGLLIDAFGTYGGEISSELAEKLGQK